MASTDPVSQYLYPLDVTGAAVSNLVKNERQTLNPPPLPGDAEDDFTATFHFILPFATPFFRDTLKITHISTGRPLTPNIDFGYGHYFSSASFETENVEGGIYASILFFDSTLSGVVQLEYQTLGGNWTLNENAIYEIMANRAADPRTATYEVVSGKPEVFPALPHEHDAKDLTGMAELVITNQDIAAAIRERTQDWLDNPPILMDEYYSKDEVDALLAAQPYERMKVLNNIGGNVTIDCLEAEVFRMIITAATTFSFTNRPGLTSAVRIIEFQVLNGGNFPITWPAGTRFPYGDRGLTTNGSDKLIIELASDRLDVTPVREMT